MGLRPTVKGMKGRTAGTASRGSLITRIVGVALLLGLLFLIFLGIRTAWRSFQGLENQVAAAVVAASATVLVSVLSVTVTRLWERHNERERELRAKRVPVYERFISEWLGLMLNSRGGQLDEERAKEFFITLTPDILVWASDEVLVQWSRERRRWTQVAEQGNAMEMMFRFEDLLLTIRRDLGHSNKGGVERGDVLGLWVNDIDDYLDT